MDSDLCRAVDDRNPDRIVVDVLDRRRCRAGEQQGVAGLIDGHSDADRCSNLGIARRERRSVGAGDWHAIDEPLIGGISDRLRHRQVG